MTPEIITYHSSNAPPTLTWLAYIVLPNGEYWGVRFNGATEEIARTKAISTWQQEQEVMTINRGEFLFCLAATELWVFMTGVYVI